MQIEECELQLFLVQLIYLPYPTHSTVISSLLSSCGESFSDIHVEEEPFICASTLAWQRNHTRLELRRVGLQIG
jgi:hypothetical protein